MKPYKLRSVEKEKRGTNQSINDKGELVISLDYKENDDE
jgi:hypothetical protein